MPERLEDHIRRGTEEMFEASTPVENLMPPGFTEHGDPPKAPDRELVALRQHRKGRTIPGWAVGVAAAAAVLLIAIPFALLPDQDADVAAPTTLPAGSVVQTLYADGNINDCPDNFADDTSRPVGQITYTPVPEGVEIHISLEDAAPDWAYVVHVFKETPASEPCAIGLDTLIGPTTNSQGQGELTQTIPLFEGVHAIGVNIAYDTSEPPESPLREITTDSYATFTVPEAAP
jgi:hypothetical protein